MTSSAIVSSPFPLFSDLNGAPLDGGYLYFGAENLDPITNPTTVYWDAALTIPAAQPVRTIGGYPSRSGSPGTLYAAPSYSITVKDSNGTLVYSSLSVPSLTAEVVKLRTDLASVADGLGDALVAVQRPYSGSVALTQHQINQERVSIFNWLTPAQIADVIARTHLVDCSAAILTALTALNGTNKTLFFPSGIYRVDSQIMITWAPQIEGESAPDWDQVTGTQFWNGAVLFSTITDVAKYALSINVASFCTGLYIKNLRITGNKTAANGLYLHNVSGMTDSLTVDRFTGTGLCFDYGQDIVNNNLHVQYCGRTAGSYAVSLNILSNFVHFNDSLFDTCPQMLKINSGGIQAIYFNNCHFEIFDSAAADQNYRFYSAPPFLIARDGASFTDTVKFRGCVFNPVSVTNLMAHYSVAAAATQFFFQANDCQSLSFEGCTFEHANQGARFLQILSTQRDYTATVNGCEFTRCDLRTEAVDCQRTTFLGNTMHGWDDGVSTVCALGKFSLSLVAHNRFVVSNGANSADSNAALTVSESITASCATNVLTVTSTPATPLVVGAAITGAGYPAGTVIASFGTGSGGAGTYNLNTTPGTVASGTVTASWSKTSGYLLFCYGSDSVWARVGVLGFNTFDVDKIYKISNAAWAVTPDAHAPNVAIGHVPADGVYDMEFERDGYILQPGGSGAVTVNTISGTKQGQVVTLQGVSSGNAVITHNATSMVLKGATNATLGTNNILKLQNLDGSGNLVEIARNF